MSKKFYAINRVTGERWKPDKSLGYKSQYLVMYDSGYLAIISQEFYTHIEPLDTKIWEAVVK